MTTKTYDDGYAEMVRRLMGVVAPGSFTAASLDGMLKCLEATRTRIEHERRSLLRSEERHIEQEVLDVAQELAPERGFYGADLYRYEDRWTIIAQDRQYEDVEFDIQPNPTDADIRAAVKAALQKN